MRICDQQDLKGGTSHTPAMKEAAGSVAHDKHHCRCFRIDRRMIGKFKYMLIRYAFEPVTLEEDHGQVFGLRRRRSEHEQTHLKVMPSGTIEAENEPPPEYPFAHLNQTHSYSPHNGIWELLRGMGIPFRVVSDVPDTCRRPVVVLPKSPVSGKTLLAIGVIGITLCTLAYVWWKGRS